LAPFPNIFYALNASKRQIAPFFWHVIFAKISKFHAFLKKKMKNACDRMSFQYCPKENGAISNISL